LRLRGHDTESTGRDPGSGHVSGTAVRCWRALGQESRALQQRRCAAPAHRFTLDERLRAAFSSESYSVLAVIRETPAVQIEVRILEYWLSAALVIGSVIGYHMCQKLIPSGAHPLLSVLVTFATATLVTLLSAPLWMKGCSLAAEVHKLNWASVALGVAIVGVDVGYLLLYRGGWDISLGGVFCNTSAAVLLVPVGVLAFKERLVSANYVGIVLASLGVWLIARR
jgi:drug/metabolite transporter (DMT)-like permease